MGKISDEIRNDFVRCDGVDVVSYRKLLSIADRIDSEMMELPKDADGVPIHVGDTVYLDDGSADKVTRICIGIYEDGIYSLVFGYNFSVRPEHVSHTKHDSLECIADELEAAKGWRDQNGEYSCIVSSVSTKTLGDWADRIRRLAENEDK